MNHGHKPKSGASATYRTWKSMKERCLYKKSRCYEYYGARGISVCERWLSFDNFLADMGIKPDGLTLDRIDNSKGYSPENCRWATMTVNIRNRRNTRTLEIGGVSRSVAEWAEISKIPYNTFRKRVSDGWDLEAAISTPVLTQFQISQRGGLTKARKQ